MSRSWGWGPSDWILDDIAAHAVCQLSVNRRAGADQVQRIDNGWRRAPSSGQPPQIKSRCARNVPGACDLSRRSSGPAAEVGEFHQSGSGEQAQRSSHQRPSQAGRPSQRPAHCSKASPPNSLPLAQQSGAAMQERHDLEHEPLHGRGRPLGQARIASLLKQLGRLRCRRSPGRAATPRPPPATIRRPRCRSSGAVGCHNKSAEAKPGQACGCPQRLGRSSKAAAPARARGLAVLPTRSLKALNQQKHAKHQQGVAEARALARASDG